MVNQMTGLTVLTRDLLPVQVQNLTAQMRCLSAQMRDLSDNHSRQMRDLSVRMEGLLRSTYEAQDRNAPNQESR